MLSINLNEVDFYFNYGLNVYSKSLDYDFFNSSYSRGLGNVIWLETKNSFVFNSVIAGAIQF